MPDFYDWIWRGRDHLGLTLETTAAHTDVTASWLGKIENERRPTTEAVAGQLASVYRFNRWQRRHTLDLLKPSATLAPADDLRRHIISPAVHAHLGRLDARRMIAGYFDPLGTVLLANESLRHAIPGLDDADDNLLLWLFTPIARKVLQHWECEAVHGVANLRGALGRYRDTPQARQLWRKLLASNDFNRLWTENPLLVAYGRLSPAPISLCTTRTPASQRRCRCKSASTPAATSSSATPSTTTPQSHAEVPPHCRVSRRRHRARNQGISPPGSPDPADHACPGPGRGGWQADRTTTDAPADPATRGHPGDTGAPSSSPATNVESCRSLRAPNPRRPHSSRNAGRCGHLRRMGGRWTVVGNHAATGRDKSKLAG
ncbi:hypothetical protein GCM10027089_35910 [Nocardia thraciensis]